MDMDGHVLCGYCCDLVNDSGLSVAWAEVEVEPAPLVSPYALSLVIKGPLARSITRYSFKRSGGKTISYFLL